jgi:DNA-directed RNA polymerase subunit RPC12/RpoP
MPVKRESGWSRMKKKSGGPEKLRSYNRKYEATKRDKVKQKEAIREYSASDKGREKSRKRYQKNNYYLKQRDSFLRKHYGITLEDYGRMLQAQGGVCAICGRPPKTKSLNVDHDHRTKQVRGLLCVHCNHRLIGRFRDSSIFRKAADYLDRKIIPGLEPKSGED